MSAAARTMASTDDNQAAIMPSDIVDDVQDLDIDDDGDIFDATGDAEDILPQSQPESYTPPDSNVEPRAVDGGVDVEELRVGVRAGEQENAESDAIEGINVEVSVSFEQLLFHWHMNKS